MSLCQHRPARFSTDSRSDLTSAAPAHCALQSPRLQILAARAQFESVNVSSCCGFGPCCFFGRSHVETTDQRQQTWDQLTTCCSTNAQQTK
ncbi:hypothetical protein EYF80_004491 [Liparis tanakae]|uniref:Uncharacterized protein n=1 Tax=Liparis tanakae TaxID=230148 RepID=A0A4Z2J5D0_9TELE|nr:hypothetical protein EYF80_004491 [Liparis tanakae]